MASGSLLVISHTFLLICRRDVLYNQNKDLTEESVKSTGILFRSTLIRYMSSKRDWDLHISGEGQTLWAITLCQKLRCHLERILTCIAKWDLHILKKCCALVLWCILFNSGCNPGLVCLSPKWFVCSSTIQTRFVLLSQFCKRRCASGVFLFGVWPWWNSTLFVWQYMLPSHHPIKVLWPPLIRLVHHVPLASSINWIVGEHK